MLRNYHAEKRFELFHYTNAGCYLSMTVDNRGGGDDDGGIGSAQLQRQSSKGEAKEGSEMISTPLEKVRRHNLWLQNLNNKFPISF